jgi:hypothetical protein
MCSSQGESSSWGKRGGEEILIANQCDLVEHRHNFARVGTLRAWEAIFLDRKGELDVNESAIITQERKKSNGSSILSGSGTEYILAAAVSR